MEHFHLMAYFLEMFKYPILSARLCLILASASMVSASAVSGYTIDKPEIKGVKNFDEGVIELRYNPEPRQEFKGWGIYPGYFHKRIWSSKWQVQDRPAVMELLADLNYTIARLEIRPEYYNQWTGEINDNIMDLVEGIRALRKYKPDVKYTISIWSPPAVMKDPPTQIGYSKDLEGYEDGIKSTLREDKEQAFCDFVVKCLQRLEKEGVGLPLALSLQNEPGHVVWYESTGYDRDKPEQYFRVNVLMDKTLEKAGFGGIDFHGPDSNDYSTARWILGGDDFSKMRAYPGMVEAWDALCTHTYEHYVKNPETRIQAIRDYQSATKKWKELKGGEGDLWMSEYSIDAKIDGVETEIDRAIFELKSMARDFIMIPHNYWVYWHAPGIHIEWNADEIHVSERYHIYRQLWANATPGSRVHEILSTDERLIGNNNEYIDLMAFTHESGGIVMLINRHQEPLKVRLYDLPGKGAARATSYLGDKRILTDFVIEDGSIAKELPAESVTFLTWSL
jgi:hypothetical protein